jgi:hypothetical protein
MTTGTILSRIGDIAGMACRARISGSRHACPRVFRNDREGTLSIRGRRQPHWVLKAAVSILAAVLVAGCTVQIQVQAPPASASSSQGASRSSPSTTPSNCSACEQLMSEFPVLAAIGLSELENLLEKYGPDLAALLYAAGLLLGS